MPLELTFTCPLPNGLHARPASAFEDVTRRFASTLTLTNERTGQAADAKSVLGIVGLAVAEGDPCRVVADGPDEDIAIATLRRFVEQQLPHCDDQLAAEGPPCGAPPLPPLLKTSGATFRHGVPVAGGIGQGRAVRVQPFVLAPGIAMQGAEDPSSEKRRLDRALARLASDYDARIERVGPGEAADVLGAHRSVARDPEFRRRMHEAIRSGSRTAAGAIVEAERYFTHMLATSGSLLLRERAIDVRDVCIELLRMLHGAAVMRGEKTTVTGDAVCVADDLTPSEFLALDRRHLKGLVLADGSTTSHTVILARSFGVPTLVGVEALDDELFDGREVVVDGDLGVLVTTITDGAARYYAMERARFDARAVRLRRMRDEPAVTDDGCRLEVGANIATADEAAVAFGAGADAIGVFRTEMLFAEREHAPTEDEQFAAYRRASDAACGRRVTVRTLDVGGDKPLPYLRLPREANPFLGYRAVRMYPGHEALFRDQVRALVRAAALGHIELMIPFVSSVEEVRWVRQVVAQEQERCGMSASLAIGAMIEVPSVAFAIDHLAPALDFFSIGSNDLLQYFVAADRGNRHVATLYDPLSPAFLRFLAMTVDRAHAHERWIGLCGEMAADARCLPLAMGLGLDEVSVSSPHVARVKTEVRSLSSAACRALLQEALGRATAAEVRELIDATDCRRPVPLLEPDLVVLGADCATKEEAIKRIADHLFALGRTDRPHDVEHALWQREAAYSTGLGHGFAIPHGRSHAARADSLVVLKLPAPIEWGSLDDAPVSVVIALVLREGTAAADHLRVLANLSRRLMHDDFRDRVMREEDAPALCTFIAEAIRA